MHTGRLSLQTGQHTPGSKVVHLAASGKKRERYGTERSYEYMAIMRTYL